jgi:small subunit ribosomal protein S20
VRAAAAPTKKKADQSAKRARQNEKRRIYHKSRKSEISTRMKKASHIFYSPFRLQSFTVV